MNHETARILHNIQLELGDRHESTAKQVVRIALSEAAHRQNKQPEVMARTPQARFEAVTRIIEGIGKPDESGSLVTPSLQINKLGEETFPSQSLSLSLDPADPSNLQAPNETTIHATWTGPPEWSMEERLNFTSLSETGDAGNEALRQLALIELSVAAYQQAQSQPQAAK